MITLAQVLDLECDINLSLEKIAKDRILDTSDLSFVRETLFRAGSMIGALDQYRKAVIELMNAPHHDHFESRTSDGELAAIIKMRGLIRS